MKILFKKPCGFCGTPYDFIETNGGRPTPVEDQVHTGTPIDGGKESIESWKAAGFHVVRGYCTEDGTSIVVACPPPDTYPVRRVRETHFAHCPKKREFARRR